MINLIVKDNTGKELSMVSTKSKPKHSSGTQGYILSEQEIEKINEKYEKGELRILTEMNREKLPNFAYSLKNTDHIITRPYYQRRHRWDNTQKSRLIESFLINIPVPPIILYEIRYNTYEVMDGQQRINAIQEFYDNKLRLTGLKIWKELNGITYKELPDKIKAGIDRRSLSTITLVTESTSDEQEAIFLKQSVFERLNTGGVNLSRQEIRNCLYAGKFNNLILELSGNPIFARAWDIPIEKEEELKKNNLYKKMEDVELILRFFALREIDNITGNLERSLDLYMIKSIGGKDKKNGQESQEFSDQKIESLKRIFLDTIELAYKVYGNYLFKPYDIEAKTWKNKAYKVYYDAVMIGFSHHLSSKDILIERKAKIIEKTKQLFADDSLKLFTGKSKTKKDLQERIEKFDNLLKEIIEK